MSKYKAVLLDADDTVFDFARSEKHALTATLTQFGVCCDDAVCRTYSEINLALWKSFERGEVAVGELRLMRFERLAQRLGLSLDPSAVNAVYGENLASCHFLLPGARRFLEHASSLCALYLTTNGIAAVQHGRIAAAEIGAYLSGVFISEQIGYPKPDRRYYDAVFAAIGRTRDECIAFGDSLTSDIAGAAGAGVDSCLFDPHRAFPNGGAATYTAHTYEEFLALLR